MNVEKIMRKDIVAAHPHEPVANVRTDMATRRLTVVPVVERDGSLIGVVTEADLLASRTPRRRMAWWEAIVADAAQLARDYRKRMGTTVADVMSPVVATVDATDSVERAAKIMEHKGLAALPVVEHAVLVGLVMRGDVIDALPGPAGCSADSADLAGEMERRMSAECWTLPSTIRVEADGALLQLYGRVRSEAERTALLTMAQGIPGCAGVEDHLFVYPQLASI
jgi:CBS domain-containing protein